MTSAGAFSIIGQPISVRLSEIMFCKSLSVDWNHYPAGAFRAIDDTLNSLHRPVASGPFKTSIDGIHSVCRSKFWNMTIKRLLVK